MAQAFLPLLLIALVLLAVILGVLWFVAQRRGHAEDVRASDLPKLRYPVPEGQDAAVVVTALQQEGFDAVVDDHGTHHDILIACPEGVDRERARARATVSHATNPEGDEIGPTVVRFDDE